MLRRSEPHFPALPSSMAIVVELKKLCKQKGIKQPLFDFLRNLKGRENLSFRVLLTGALTQFSEDFFRSQN